MEGLPVFGIAFVLGLVHALDADHVMAVSLLNNRNPSPLRMLRFCAHWATGHAGVLLISGLLLFGLGLQLSESLQQIAEASIGVLLIVVGLLWFWQFRRQQLTLVQHNHSGVTHHHWHVAGDVTRSGHGKQSGHAPTMVGVLHGLAGTAPALALVPAVAQGEILSALSYLLVFSLATMLSMLLFGLGFGLLQQQLQKKTERLFYWIRHLLAASSVVFGCYWLGSLN